MEKPLSDGVLTFLLTDIEGSVPRWEAAPAAMRRVLRRHDEIMRQEILCRGGHVFRTAGDSFHAAFALPAMAIAAAVAAQRALLSEDFSAVGSLRVRMAIHSGPVESRDGDYYGAGINQAARLLAVSHGGQILISGTSSRLLGNELPESVRLTDLGRYYLRNSEAPEQLFQAAADDLPGDFPAIASVGRPPNNIVSGTTSFVGRETERAEIKRAFGQARLVTLLGNGGAGKTRLANEAALELMPRFPEGVWFIDLASVEDPNLVPDKVATAIGARSSTDQGGAASVARTLRDGTTLLIFDNCEHLLTAAADLADYILSRCPSVSILATSRHPLAIPGEHIIPISNLNVSGDGSLSPEAALASPAVKLFVDRAEASAHFALTESNVKWVVDVCRQLDGIPLAIELAAPQLRSVKLEKLSGLLRESFAVTSKLRTTPDRHRTLASTFEWSYRLLTAQERLLLQRLSVFASGCNADGAVAVCGWGALAAADVRPLLPDLADKSLVVIDLSGVEERFRLLETTRRYALEKLREQGDEREARRRLSVHLAQSFYGATIAWSSVATDAWKERYGPELDNTRMSLEWAFGPDGDRRLGIELVSVTLRLWDEFGLLPERQKWFDLALTAAHPELPPDVLARLYIGNSSLKAAADPRAFGKANRAIDLLRTLPVSLDLGEALAKAGASLLSPDNVEAARGYLSEAHEILLSFGATKQLASCLRSLCAMHFFQGDFPAARQFAMEAESVCRKIGDAAGLDANRVNLADVDFASGDADGAIRSAREILRRGAAGPRLLALCQANLTSYLICTDNLDEAEASAIKALDEGRALSWAAAVARSLSHLALVRALHGDRESAAQVVGYVESRASDWLETNEPIERILLARLKKELSAGLAPDRLELLRRVGAGCSEDEACSLAVGAIPPLHGSMAGTAADHPA